ncbi:hypothetical protein CPB83DRAFT_851899 [Crepidotus variabilis]|uniref:Uncharacterized protein n=1 Tax=Crepidotus variabilis TaxID=179855 RepID=A0A9P6EJC8_9AGAR|nr:hypothetical protein CPB83DRAFT_851899 [Crepidotus variabilis]
MRTWILDNKGKVVEVSNYAKVQGIFIGCVATFIIIVTLIGPDLKNTKLLSKKAEVLMNWRVIHRQGSKDRLLLCEDPSVALKRNP